MVIRLKPATEAMIEAEIKPGGPYESVNDFVEHAVAMLREQEHWLADHRADIAAKIEEAYTAAQRDELADEETVRDRMEARKRGWRKE